MVPLLALERYELRRPKYPGRLRHSLTYRVRVKPIRKSGINQIAIIPYGAKGENREDTLRGFAKAIK